MLSSFTRFVAVAAFAVVACACTVWGSSVESEGEATQLVVAKVDDFQVAAVVKVTPLTGELPPGHDPDQFAQRARNAVYGGFEHLDCCDAVELGPRDRMYFLDFHPYLSADGEVTIAAALYTEFDCVTPAYRRYEGPCAGPWDELADVFAYAARDLEEALLHLAYEDDAAAGEGFCAVDAGDLTEHGTSD